MKLDKLPSAVRNRTNMMGYFYPLVCLLSAALFVCKIGSYGDLESAFGLISRVDSFYFVKMGVHFGRAIPNK